MKTIKQQTTVSYNALNVQEVIVMLPVMDNLAREFRSAYSRKTNSEIAFQEYRKKGLQLLTLHKLGFCTTDPMAMQWDCEDFPEAEELEAQYRAEREKYHEVKSNQSTGLSIVPSHHEE